MKVLKMFLALVILSLSLVSCKKETPIVEHKPFEVPVKSLGLPTTSGDTVYVVGDAVEYAYGATSRLLVSVSLNKAVDQDVDVTLGFRVSEVTYNYTVTVEKGKVDQSFITEVSIPLASSPEGVGVKSVLCSDKKWFFLF